MNTVRKWLGGLLNTLGVPGFVRDGVYRSTQFDTHVRVTRGKRYTVICVNGVDLFFHRLSGRIDGVGLSSAGDCMPASVPESAIAAVIDVDETTR